MPRPLPLQQLHTLVFAAYLLGPLLFVAIQQQWRRGAIAPHCKGELVASGFDSILYARRSAGTHAGPEQCGREHSEAA